MGLYENFEKENEKIFLEAKQAEKEAREKVAEYEKKLAKIRARKEKAAAVFEDMRARFEKLEEEVRTAERGRISTAAAKKSDVLEGKISAEEYFRTGRTEQQIDQAARMDAAEKLNPLLETIRSKGRELLEIEVEEAECEMNLLHMNTYPVSFMLERMRTQVKNLEAALISNPGGFMPNWMEIDRKKEALKRARGKAFKGEIWHGLDLAAVKRLRFEAALPDSELPKLNAIIAEMEARPDSMVTLKYDGMGDERGLSVMVRR